MTRVNATSILFSFVGNRDPYCDDASEEIGPILSLLEIQTFAKVYLFCSSDRYFERARSVEQAAKEITPNTVFSFISIDLESPVDYEEIFAKLKSQVDNIGHTLSHRSADISVLADSGTPQIQTTWFLLVKSGYLNARLLQGVPPQFAGGSYKVKEINLEKSSLPGITIHPDGETDKTEKQPKDNKSDTGMWRTSVHSKAAGSSQKLSTLYNTARQVASYDDVSVIIYGETGSGKELLARFIHEHSGRAKKPFLAVNCAAITPSLAESELFGFAKGAFTGADKDRLGKFRTADGGTVFLDEIGDMPLDIQPKLLRLLEEKAITPVGYDKPIHTDVRILAATHHNLVELVQVGKFRQDLHQRLNQVPLTVPPLRERTEDIPLLIQQFLHEWNQRYNEQKQVKTETKGYLEQYPWPGNVRELKNTITNMCAISPSETLTPGTLPPPIRNYFRNENQQQEIPLSLPEEGIDLKALLYNIEENFYREALQRTNGNREQAAVLLSLNPHSFRKALRERFGYKEN